MMFMHDEKELTKLRNKCLNGEKMCGECKSLLIEKITSFLQNHQKKREKARDQLDQYIITEKVDLKQLIKKI